jgi:hypothetical protein
MKFAALFLMLQSDTVRMNTNETEHNSEWQKTPYANLVRYKSSGIFFARFRVRGKLIRRSLKTSQMSVAKLRLADLEKQERQRAEHQTAVADGTMAFADALAICKQRLAGDGSLKPRSKVYREERIAALLKSWPGLAKTDTRKISKSDCLTWAADYGQKTMCLDDFSTRNGCEQAQRAGKMTGICHGGFFKAKHGPGRLRLKKPPVQRVRIFSCRRRAATASPRSSSVAGPVQYHGSDSTMRLLGRWPVQSIKSKEAMSTQ